MKERKNTYKGALTVEAALVFPIFIFAVIAFLSLFQIMIIQGRVQWALMETSLEASRYAYIYQDVMGEEQTGNEQGNNSYQSLLGHLVDGGFYQQCFNQYMRDGEGKWLYNQTFLTGNISFLQSEFLQDGEHIDVIASYQIKLPIQILQGKTYTFVQRSRVRGFIGTTGFGAGNGNANTGSAEDTIVYITDTGTVYHRSAECTHLKLSISSVNFSEISQLRNEYGSKYKPCEICVKTAKIADSNSVYIAKEGNRYHNDKNCSGLKRTVIEVKLSEVGGRPPCSRCGN